ncbi:MAG: flagellin [Clostridia bacterium]|nr:flagellin [Clostridia bacterium]
MRINHNIAALNTYRQLSANNVKTSLSLEKLSSGSRINRAGDDAAGLAISEKMRSQIRGLDQAGRNAQDGISMIQTAEGALNETHSILQRMRELAVQAGSDTNTLDDRKEMQKEIEQLKSEVNRISDTTEFNTQKLLNGSLGAVGTSSDKTKVDIVSVTGLKTGDYNVTIGTEATQASAVAGGLDLSGGDVDMSGKVIIINGTTIDFAGMTSVGADDVQAKINTYTNITGVVATNDGTNIKLDQASFGSDAEIKLTGTNAADVGGAVTAGVDAVVTITDEDSVAQTITGVGQSVIYQGAEFTAIGDDATDETITVDSSGASLQIGSNSGQEMLIDINEMSTTTLGNDTDGLVSAINVQTQTGAGNAIKTLDAAIQEVSAERSKLGAFQNRLEHSINNLGTSAENLTAAESRVRDLDMAKEMTEFTKNNILSQAAQAMLAQANQQPQSILQLLR